MKKLIVRHKAFKLARLMNNFETPNATFHLYEFLYSFNEKIIIIK